MSPKIKLVPTEAISVNKNWIGASLTSGAPPKIKYWHQLKPIWCHPKLNCRQPYQMGTNQNWIQLDKLGATQNRIGVDWTDSSHPKLNWGHLNQLGATQSWIGANYESMFMLF